MCISISQTYILNQSGGQNWVYTVCLTLKLPTKANTVQAAKGGSLRSEAFNGYVQISCASVQTTDK